MIPFIDIPAWLFWLLLGAFVSWAAWFLTNLYFLERSRQADPAWLIEQAKRDRAIRHVKPLGNDWHPRIFTDDESLRHSRAMPESWCGYCGSTLHHPQEAPDVCPTYEAMVADALPVRGEQMPRITDDESLAAARDADRVRRAAR